MNRTRITATLAFALLLFVGFHYRKCVIGFRLRKHNCRNQIDGSRQST
jgi:hypothetical protein